jgi:hypothetical protein
VADLQHPAGAWRPDPKRVHRLRYWDGDRWTSWVADAHGAFVDTRSVIVLHRARAWGGSLRSYRVFIDGEKAGYVSSGETRAFLVSRGQHRVRVRLDWAGSREVEVSVPPDAELRCRPRGGSLRSFALAFVSRGRSLQLDTENSPERPPNAGLVVAGSAIWIAFFAAVPYVLRWLPR